MSKIQTMLICWRESWHTQYTLKSQNIHIIFWNHHHHRSSQKVLGHSTSIQLMLLCHIIKHNEFHNNWHDNTWIASPCCSVWRSFWSQQMSWVTGWWEENCFSLLQHGWWKLELFQACGNQKAIKWGVSLLSPNEKHGQITIWVTCRLPWERREHHNHKLGICYVCKRADNRKCQQYIQFVTSCSNTLYSWGGGKERVSLWSITKY